jgi:hypothetical protein
MGNTCSGDANDPKNLDGQSSDFNADVNGDSENLPSRMV